MTAVSAQPAPALPIPAGRRFTIATASSLAFHALVVLLVGLLASRAVAPPEVLIPVELTMGKLPAPQPEKLVLAGGGHPQGPPKTSDAPAVLPRPTKRTPSSLGGRLKAAPAPPRILTSRKGAAPSGPVAHGREPGGPGGKEEVPNGPTCGPEIVGGPMPIYPKNALDQGLEGTVTLSVMIGEDGSLRSVAVAKSSGHVLLDDAAIRALKQGWAFKAGLAKGKPAAGKVTVTFVFSASSVKKG
jgi:protein TonB